MATINHVSGKSYRVCTDADNDVYDELSFETDASDVIFTDGTDAESSLSQIKGITSDITGEAEDIAASIKVVNQLNDSLKSTELVDVGNGVYYKKSGNIVNVIISGYAGEVTSNYLTIATLPNEFRPSVSFSAPVLIGMGLNVLGMITIETSGVVKISTNNGNTQYATGSVVFSI